MNWMKKKMMTFAKSIMVRGINKLEVGNYLKIPQSNGCGFPDDNLGQEHQIKKLCECYDYNEYTKFCSPALEFTGYVALQMEELDI